MADSIPADDIAAAAEFAGGLIRISRPIIEKYFRQPLTIETKHDASPVTIADRETEAALRQAIAARFPDHGIAGEEEGVAEGRSALTWVIDPIDGTRAFTCGNPLFGTLIALCDGDGVPLLGMIDLPALGQCWLGVDGKTTLNGKTVSTAQNKNLAIARITTTGINYLGDRADGFNRLAAQCATIAYGGDCANYAHLATGWCDIVAEANLKPHDIMAAVPVIEGAGGVLTCWDGSPIRLGDYDGTALACATPELHEQAVGVLAKS